MSYERFIEEFKKLGVIQKGHFRLRSGKHSERYVEKSLIYVNSDLLSKVCWAIARLIVENGWSPDVIVAPATGGIALEVGVARELSMWLEKEVAGIYAEKSEKIISVLPQPLPDLWDDKSSHAFDDGYAQSQIRGVLYRLREYKKVVSEDMMYAASVFMHLGGFAEKGDEILVRKKGFVFKRGYGSLIAGKRVVLLDDILTTGGTLAALADAARSVGGEITGAVVVWNRSEVRAQDIGVPRLVSLVSEIIPSWTEEECKREGRLCARGMTLEIK